MKNLLIKVPKARMLLTILCLLFVGIGQMWARTFSGGEIIYLTGGKFSNGSSDWNYSSTVLVLRSTSESNIGATLVQVNSVAGNSGYYKVTMPSGNWNYCLVVRTEATTWSDFSWGGGSKGVWNQTWQISIDGTANLLTGFQEGTSNNTWKWMIPKGATFYIDKTNISGWGNNYYLRIGTTSSNKKYDFSGTLVTGTDRLYKCTMTENYLDYSHFVVSNNYGWTGSNSIYNIGGGSGHSEYISHQIPHVGSTTLTGLEYTFIPTGATSSGDAGQCTYHTSTNYQGSKIFTITNRSVDHATVELYYWDESNVMQTVAEGESANVLPTTKVWCKVRPDDGYVLQKVNLYDPTVREWTDASNDGSGRNLYIVRKNVEFEAVIEEYATKTILVKDVHSWAPNIYFKGWNPFLYDEYDNAKYYTTTQKMTDKVRLCGNDYYVVTFTNEYPFYYMHNANDANRTNFFTPSRLTHMNKYDNYYTGSAGSWGLREASCSDDIYWVEVTTGSGEKFISNIVASTSDTMSFYVGSGSTVDFHKNANSPVNKYSTNFASFFSSGGALYGKDGAVFTAKTDGTGLTNVAIYEGDYFIHCNATTKNYLDGGASKAGTTGTKFIQFNISRIFKDTYDHYWVDWFDGGQTVVGSVGNTYNPNLAGVLGADELAPAGVAVSDGGYDGGNVRFAYNPSNNSFTRSILSGGGSLVKISSLGADSVKVIDPNDTSEDPYQLDAYGTPRSFDDATNWVYTLDAKVLGTSHATVTSTYNSVAYTLADKKKLMGGDDGTKYEVELSYDFKTNRLLAAWMPKSGEAISEFSLESNLMVVRREDETPTVLNISGANHVTDISKIYTTFEFWKSSWDDSEAYANRRITSGSYDDEFYWFSLPYKCYMGDVFGIEGYGPDGNWVIMTYHGDYRAKEGWWAETDHWWYYLDRTDTLQANQGYVLRVTNLDELFPEDKDPKLYLYFPSYDENLTIEEIGTGTPKTLQTTVPAHECTIWRGKEEGTNEGNPSYDRRAIDSNWNVIGSPSFNTATLKNTDFSTGSYPTSPNVKGDLKYFFTWSAATGGTNKYTIQNATDFQFKALSAYLVQYAGTINWQAGTGTNPLVGFTKAPAHNQEESGEQTLRLVLNKDGQQADVAYISRMAEGATEGYDLNMDLSKLMNQGDNNIYTIAGYYKMAGNCLPDTTETIPVGVQLATAGEYTFSIPEGTNGTGVTLIDNVANTSTNLALTDYTVNLEAGKCDGRFMLKLSPIANTPTGVDLINGENGTNGVRKVMCDGVLYIVKDGEVFDARGNHVK